MKRVSCCALLLLFASPGAGHAAAQSGPPEPARVEAYAKLLPEAARGVGAPIDDRAAWDAIAGRGDPAKAIRDAERLIGKPLPELSDDLYLEFSREGNRTHYQKAFHDRHGRLGDLVIAECVENQGRFVPEIERVLRAICEEKTWVYPAHDRALTNFKGTQITVDLVSSAIAWELATADYWLAKRLSPEIRDRLHAELERRIFAPFERMVRTGKPAMWWLRGTNNWNAVCLANVTGAAVTAIESRERRAFVVASTEKYIRSFLRGFTPDGYCSEGLGYWGYGFGHYVMLGELMLQQTGGQADLFGEPLVRAVAQFARRMEILPGVYPAFADCNPSAQPAAWMMTYLNRKYDFGWPYRRDPIVAVGGADGLAMLGLFGFPNSVSDHPATETAEEQQQPLRDYFSDAGVLVCRTARGAKDAMGVALKGGHNDEHHNHNDVGSYVVALGRRAPLVDPGNEVYTRRTFSGDRYNSGVLNSWGHPVPRVAGELQRTGRRAKADVLKTDFTDEIDTYVLDLSSAYDVKSLAKLVRSFVFARKDRGSLVVRDEVAFDSPQSFGTALITFEKWREVAPGVLAVGQGAEGVEIRIDAGGAAFSIQSDAIDEDVPGRVKPTRIGIDLDDPVREAAITLTIRPLEP
ncbi:MAG: heparinase II/III family protein [Pirellulales bacterium]|nr:heparinase II/III family protein [Pirellulales bacterium]